MNGRAPWQPALVYDTDHGLPPRKPNRWGNHYSENARSPDNVTMADYVRRRWIPEEE